MNREKIAIVLGLSSGMIMLVILIGFIGQGNVREVPLYYSEKVEQTVAFEDDDSRTYLVAIKGVKGDINPTLLTRTSYAYVLTVINNGNMPHMLYVRGLNVQTKLLQQGQNDTIIIIPKDPGNYPLYDRAGDMTSLGQIQVKTVVPSDEFQGFLKDLI